MVVQPDALNPSCREWGGDQTGSDHRQRVRGGRGGVTQPGPLQGWQLEGKRISSTMVSGPDSKDPVLDLNLKKLYPDSILKKIQIPILIQFTINLFQIMYKKQDGKSLCEKGIHETKFGFRVQGPLNRDSLWVDSLYVLSLVSIVYECIYLSQRDEAGQLDLDPVVATDTRLCERLFFNKETVSRRITFDTPLGYYRNICFHYNPPGSVNKGPFFPFFWGGGRS